MDHGRAIGGAPSGVAAYQPKPPREQRDDALCVQIRRFEGMNQRLRELLALAGEIETRLVGSAPAKGVNVALNQAAHAVKPALDELRGLSDQIGSSLDEMDALLNRLDTAI